MIPVAAMTPVAASWRRLALLSSCACAPDLRARRCRIAHAGYGSYSETPRIYVELLVASKLQSPTLQQHAAILSAALWLLMLEGAAGREW